MTMNFIDVHQNLLTTINFDERQCDDIVFGLNFPKEIVFTKVVNNSEDIDYSFLNKIYSKIKILNYDKINSIELILSKNQKFIFQSKIQDVFYRTVLYSEQGKLMFKLYLSIRFKEDHPIIYNKEKNILICDIDCKYFDQKKHYCNFFHENLSEMNEICVQCFLQEENVQIRKLVEYDCNRLEQLDEKYTNRQK